MANDYRCCAINTRALVPLLAALAAVLLVASACGGDGEGEGPGLSPTVTDTPTATATPTPRPTPAFSFEGPIGIDLTTFGALFEQSEPIQFGVVVAVRDPMTLYYPTSQRFDLTVRNSEGEEVWRWSEGRSFTEAEEEATLEANETLSFTALWDQRDNNDRQVPPGDYEVVSESSHCDEDLENCGQLTTSGTIHIRPSSEES